MNKAISTPIAIIIVLMVFSISIGLILLGYIYWPKEEVVLEETEGIDTSNWNTYRNEEYGFEFKYPTDWILEGNRFLSPENVALNKNTALPSTYSLSVGYVLSQERFLKDMREFRLKNNLDNEYFFADYTNLKNYLKSVNGNVAEINIEGKKAIVSVLSTSLNEFFIYIESGGEGYVVFRTPAYSASNPSSLQLLAEKPIILPEVKNIISTLKFTK